MQKCVLKKKIEIFASLNCSEKKNQIKLQLKAIDLTGVLNVKTITDWLVEYRPPLEIISLRGTFPVVPLGFFETFGKNLKIVDLTNTKYTIEEFVEIIKRIPNVEELYLNNAQHYIATAVKQILVSCNRLKKVGLVTTPSLILGAQSLLEALRTTFPGIMIEI